MSQIPTEYLSHILDEANYLLEESQDLGKSQFLADETRFARVECALVVGTRNALAVAR